MDRREALRRVHFLKTLPEPAIDKLVTVGLERTLGRGEQLLHEHQRCTGLMVVLTGSVKMYKVDARGRELILGIDGPGSSIAELSLFDGGNYPTAAEAVVDDTRIYTVDRDTFLTFMAAYPEIATQALRALSIRMRRLYQLVEGLSMHTVRARLAGYLMELAGGRQEFTLDDTNEEIAGMIGTVRDVVSRTLSGLRDSHVIEMDGRRVTVPDPAVLARIAGALDR